MHCTSRGTRQLIRPLQTAKGAAERACHTATPVLRLYHTAAYIMQPAKPDSKCYGWVVQQYNAQKYNTI